MQKKLASAPAVVQIGDRRPWTSDRFVDVLKDRASELEGGRKGDRTKARLRVATAEALEAVGYREMTVADICRFAGVTPAVLYLYYESKPAIVLEILTEFLNEFFSTARTPRADTVFEAMRVANLRWIRLARANAGLMRCLLHLRDDEAAFAKLYAEANRQWYARTVKAWAGRFAKSTFDPRIALLIEYSFAGLLDELVRMIFISPDDNLVGLLADLSLDDEALAEYVALIWYRAMALREPAGLSPRLAALFRPLRESRRSGAGTDGGDD
jgi:AcrR family transcriptional regulator